MRSCGHEEREVVTWPGGVQRTWWRAGVESDERGNPDLDGKRSDAALALLPPLLGCRDCVIAAVRGWRLGCTSGASLAPGLGSWSGEGDRVWPRDQAGESECGGEDGGDVGGSHARGCEGRGSEGVSHGALGQAVREPRRSGAALHGEAGGNADEACV